MTASDHLSLWGEQKKEKCNQEVVCYDYLKRNCLREKGHQGGHNPFSDSFPGDENETKIQKTNGAH